MKIKHLMYGLLCIAYILFSFYCFPRFNSNVAFGIFVVVAIGAWVFGTRFGLMTSLICIPYHYFLFNYYADIISFYQGKATGTLSIVIISLIAGSLKELRDGARHISIMLDQRVAERTKELNELIIQLITDDENIRRFLGQDIHDGLGQNLTGLLLYSSSLSDDLKKSHSNKVLQMEDLVNDAEKNLNMARRISRTLFPFKMMETGLDAAFDELTSYFSEITDVSFEVFLDGSERHLAGNTMIHFYRIVHETILNTLHNDTPSHIRVNLRTDKNHHVINTEIDGCDEPEKICNGMFVELMRYRAELISGQLMTTTTNTGRLTISCSVPKTNSMARKASDAAVRYA